jgi:phosphate transport system protein
MRITFEEQLRLLNQELLEMGALIEHAIQSASEALISRTWKPQTTRSRLTARWIKRTGYRILCLKLLLQQQPVAKDLRLISAALKMITDMERIGDQASDISGIVILSCWKTIHQVSGASAADGGSLHQNGLRQHRRVYQQRPYARA